MVYSTRRSITSDEHARLASFSPVLAHLLFHRGFKASLDAQNFISPDYDLHTHDPFLLKDTEKSAERIIRAVVNNEKIVIYSDYDADGIPGAVIWHDFFNRIGYKNFSIYIPHRHNEGFGLNTEAIKQLAHEKVELLITLDCGITDVKPVEFAVEKGIDVIITDHHEPPALLPPAFGIIDHKQNDCTYPDKNLCGSGVAYKLIQAVIKKEKIERENKNNMESVFKNGWKDGHEKWLLDMVGIATLSDMVSLTGENRVFAYYGLEVLRKSPRKGLVRLLEKLKISQRHLTEDDITFMITPRINAASRIGLPMDAFSLLSAQSDEDAQTYADHLDSINNERKGVVAALSKEIKKILHERYSVQNNQFTISESVDSPMTNDQNSGLPAVIVLGNPNWRPSLLGLVANTCAEQFGRPVFLWGRDGDGMIKGSCRSEGVSNVVDIMHGVPKNVFIKYGGHKHSGGFEVSSEQIHFLDKHLNEAQEKIKESRLKTQESETDLEAAEDNIIDMELKLDDVDWSLYNDIAKLAPFGINNPKPLFLFKKVSPTAVKIFGKTKEHVEVSFAKSNSQKISAISFFGAGEKWANEISVGRPVDLIASVEKSLFAGRTELRLRIVDVLI
jgi:single-stranded-DNA-specific exonuclease